MSNFFSLNPSNLTYKLNIFEKYTPLFILFFMIILLLIFKNKIKSNKHLEYILRCFTSITSLIFLVIYYILEWSQNGLNVSNLPLHLCFISNILAIILCFNKSKTLFNFLVFCGVLGGASSLIWPDLSLSYMYFRYYQFMICHISIIIIPLYFILIYDYFPTIKDSLITFLLLQVIGIPLGIFNEIFKTNYMFISFTSNFAAKNSILESLDAGKFYFIKLEILSFVVIIAFYFTLKLIFKIFPKLIFNNFSHNKKYIGKTI